MRGLIAGFLGVLLAASTPAVAQTPDPVMEHYRTYRAAYDGGDMEAAERAADAALAASEARDGGGGRTAVLAANLAVVRMMRDNPAALAPAQRAFELAQAGASGLDPLFAALVLGRAELRVEDPAGADRLRSVLQTNQLEAIPEADLYNASTELGRWSFARQDYEIAELAWSVAAAHAAASVLGERFSYGVARTWQGASMLFDEIGPRGSRRMSQDRGGETYLVLTEAVQSLRETSQSRTPDEAITLGVRAYGEALALRSITRAKLRSDGRDVPETAPAEGDIDGFAELVGPTSLAPRCSMGAAMEPPPHFPRGQLVLGRLGAVVVLLRFDENGNTLSSELLSSIGDDSFADAVMSVAREWNFERLEDSAAGCRMPRTLIVPVSFGIRP
jgi:hypothetical protein